ncbi:MAG: hypothetical protein KC609_11655, partial [Myxococcales bacterium]|nr:hypothetical protein [Myxococcales bacterium]
MAWRVWLLALIMAVVVGSACGGTDDQNAGTKDTVGTGGDAGDLTGNADGQSDDGTIAPADTNGVDLADDGTSGEDQGGLDGLDDGIGDSVGDGVGDGTAEEGAPVIQPIGDQSALAGQPFSIKVSVSDPEDDQITLSAVNLP